MSTQPVPRLSQIVKANLSIAKLQESTQPFPSKLFPPELTKIPSRLHQLEPREPFRLIHDNPIFDIYDAARILGISQQLLEKWRQRGQGPDYIQYGPAGPVRYELSALKRFKAMYRIRPTRQPRTLGVKA